MGDITTADLLTVQRNITDAHREDMKVLKEDLSDRVAEVRQEVAEVREEHGAQIRELRTVLEERTTGLGLTKAQKTALWAGISGLALEGGRHLKTLFFGLFCLVKGSRL